jgi:hypothetical protein
MKANTARENTAAIKSVAKKYFPFRDNSIDLPIFRGLEKRSGRRRLPIVRLLLQQVMQ